MSIISTSLTVRGQPPPRFHVETWLPLSNCEIDYRFVKNFLQWGAKNFLAGCNDDSVLISDFQMSASMQSVERGQLTWTPWKILKFVFWEKIMSNLLHINQGKLYTYIYAPVVQ